MSESTKEHKAKGAMMVALAMLINSTKNLDWAKAGLSEADLQIIHNGIISSRWYERALWERMSLAVYRLVGQSKPENAFVFGHGLLAETLLKIYQGPLAIDDPREILGKFAIFYGSTWYNFGKAEFKSTEKGGVFSVIHEDGIPIPECFVPMIRGVLSRLVEANHGRNVKAEGGEQHQINRQKFTQLNIELSWEQG
jgi:hypothetical protein